VAFVFVIGYSANAGLVPARGLLGADS